MIKSFNFILKKTKDPIKINKINKAPIFKGSPRLLTVFTSAIASNLTKPLNTIKIGKYIYYKSQKKTFNKHKKTISLTGIAMQLEE